MARTRALDYDAQRDRILARAVDAFARTGYASASMAMLAQACGISKATLYHYYPSKQALLFEALDRYTQRLATTVVNTEVDGDAREALRAMLRALMAEYRHSHAYHVALLQDLRFLSASEQDTIRAQQRAVVEAIATRLERAAPAGLPPGERSVITMALLGMINFTFAWLRPDGAIDHQRFADLAASLWLDGLAGQPIPQDEEADEQAVRIEG